MKKLSTFLKNKATAKIEESNIIQQIKQESDSKIKSFLLEQFNVKSEDELSRMDRIRFNSKLNMLTHSSKLNESNDLMSDNDILNVYNSLKKNDYVEMSYGSSINKLTVNKFIVSKGKTVVGKRKVERITLKSLKNIKGVKYYLYRRGDKVTLAIGDMGASLKAIKVITLDETLDFTINEEKDAKKAIETIYKNAFGDQYDQSIVDKMIDDLMKKGHKGKELVGIAQQALAEELDNMRSTIKESYQFSTSNDLNVFIDFYNNEILKFPIKIVEELGCKIDGNKGILEFKNLNILQEKNKNIVLDLLEKLNVTKL